MAARTIERTGDARPAPRHPAPLPASETTERTVVVVAARDEAARIGATLAALRRGLPHAELWVADDGSRDQSAVIARAMGARVVRRRRARGKGAAIEAALGAALAANPASEERSLVILCDGDLAESAYALCELARVAARRPRGLVVARFAESRGGGFGLLRRMATAAIARERRSGERPRAPLSGQRAMHASELRELLPFAAGYGLEVGMTIDAMRAGMTLVELPLALTHRALGRTPAGFLHRARQALHVTRAVRARRRGPAAARRRVTSGRRGRTPIG